MLDQLTVHGRFPDLKNPKTFNDKIAWRMLYDHDPRMPPLVDKILVKEIMSTRFGSDFIIPTLGIFDNEQEIDFSKLAFPCVIKANHGSGMNIFLKEPPKDPEKIRKELGRFLRSDFHSFHEEWVYSQIKRRLIVEPLIGDNLIDYKLHTYRGEVLAIQIDVDRYIDHRRCFKTPTWENLPITFNFPLYPGFIPRPFGLEKMLWYASQIGEEFSYVRIDLYKHYGCVKFGEITFYPEAGIGKIYQPMAFEEIFSKPWTIP
jgi:hypothetical protein